MKQIFSVGFLLLALAGVARGQSFTNSTTFNAPPSTVPQIDATNFVNLGPFNIDLSSSEQFDFSDVLFFTNRSVLTCNTGFIFDTAPSDAGNRRAAASFGNSNQGVVSVGSITNGISLSLVFPYSGFVGFPEEIFDLPEMDISASNVVNTGLLNVGVTGIMNVGGNHVDLSKGLLHVEGFDTVSQDDLFSGSISNLLIGTDIIEGGINGNNLGIFNVFEGIGLQTNQLTFGNFNLIGVHSPFNLVTNTAGAIGDDQVAPPNATPYVFLTQVNNSNTLYQVVFINTNLPGIATDVRFENGGTGGAAIPVVQWSAVITNSLGVATGTNFLYLSDQFGSFPTNFLVTNSYTFTGVPILSPFNYTFNRSFAGYTNLPMANMPYDAQTVFAAAFVATNAYSALEVNVTPVIFEPDITSAANSLTNLPGRISIDASNWLDLTRTTITGPNYISIAATNHFVGSSNATIVVPNMDINVGSTNGTLTISNLVAANIPRFNGVIDMWSGRWTNTVVTTFMGTNFYHTNTFHVLIVESGLSPLSSPSVLNFGAHSTNMITHTPGTVVISDILDITNSFLVDAENLTVTTNGFGAPTETGELNLLNPAIDWPSSAPILQNLTNWGVIETSDNTVFEGVRQPPDYSSSFVEPYLSFVNHGLVVTAGQTIVANYIENTSLGSSVFQFGQLFFTNTSFGALLYSTAGPINIAAGNALFTNGTIEAVNGDLTLTADFLTNIDHALVTSGALTLSVSNLVNDGGSASSNFWSAADGMNLLAVATNGNFLGTTVTLTSPPSLEVSDVWAGLDLGATPAGFVANGAVGHLILNGGNDLSEFGFAGPDMTTNYALYVDLLELQNGATNRSGGSNTNQDFTTFDIASNFKIYYADAVIGPFDIAEKLQQGNNHQLIWVPSFAGIFSSTNLVDPAGHTNTFNRALVDSTDIDSNGNGTANAFDSDPIYTADDVHLSIAITNAAANKIVTTIEWAGLANSTNFLYYNTNLLTTNWTPILTNIQGRVNGTISVNRTNSPGFYRVQVNPSQP